MIYGVLAVAILSTIIMFVVVAVGTGLSDGGYGTSLFRSPTPPRMSTAEVTAIFLLAVVAIGTAVYVATATSGVWWVVPVAAWAVFRRGVRKHAETRERRRLDLRRREARRLAEQRDREMREQELRQRERLDRYGKEGLKLLDKADAAVNAILATEAARTGWLGEPADLDFRADVATIAETLSLAMEIRTTVADYSSIPKPSSDDVRLLKDAKRRLKQLESAARHRVELLCECVGRAEQVDQMLRDDREQSRVAQKRDVVGGRLRALLSGAELTPPAEHSDSVDLVSSRVEAFREVRDLIRGGRSDPMAAEMPVDRTLASGARRAAKDVLRRFRR
ncbi:hypothetical protein F0Q45_21390 [Mycobacterium simiae]|uniref:Uncharacterized protein n=1 Tax=Mycobacterium simiae TaxID=1784 RepID=A0A5B1BLC4_MYCSI|nr:hypothetical protein [Mycobacterium simiae]KAA1248290.1 hypothetical protein F0Q45_21390 [Mycobacterium simiae]